MMRTVAMDHILAVPDWPKKGVTFRDITPLLANYKTLLWVTDELWRLSGWKFNTVVAVEARGFVIGAALAGRFHCGFVPVRKAGKLPREVHSAQYSLEYGQDCLNIHKDAIKSGAYVTIVDDVLATGGTARATADLVEKCGGIVDCILFLVEIEDLKGRDNLRGYRVETIFKY